MSQEDQLMRENQELRNRLSRLIQASLRINQSLDFDTVLQGALDSARSLTGARYGVMTLLDDAGQVQDFLSSGMTDDEAGQVWDIPERWKLFEYLNSISEPLRVPDLIGHIRSVGLPEFHPPLEVGPVVSFLASPVFNRGKRVGDFFLAEKDAGPEFTPEDEDILALFASQAAIVISNARMYRDEQRARADLEVLIDTSPVGVAVFDARTGTPKSLNREARRIADGLRQPDQSPEQLLEVLVFRREDGEEVSLQEFPLIQLLNIGETLRAEEIVVHVPDGRSVTLLVSATPIHSEEGDVASLVVTLQDMTALEDLERLRAEFLAMVSHELRTPLAAVKGSVTTLLDTTATLNPAEVVQFHQIIDSQADRMRELISDLLDVARIETGTLAVSPEPTDLAVLVEEARKGFISSSGRHGINIDIALDLPWVMADRLRMVQVLSNLLTNAARHSPGSSPIQVSAVRDGVHIAVSVSDQGRGIPAESLPNLFRKFSRIESEEQGGETGLGLAICKGIVEAHGGRIWAESDGLDLGARFIFTIPVAAEPAIAPAATLIPLPARSSRKTMAEQVRILAVEDDIQALRYVRYILSKEGYITVGTGDPAEALRLVEENRPHLILLDLVLPGIDGIDLMKDILGIADVPVIFLSAYGRDEVVTRALDMGAVDYIVKPFSPTELVARIRAALRNRTNFEPLEPFVLRDLAIDYAARSVTLAGNPVQLTAIEYRMLVELSANAGRVASYAHLLQRIWGGESQGDLRPMRTVVSSLRRKLGDDADNSTYIFTEPRIGYRMPKGEEKMDQEEI